MKRNPERAPHPTGQEAFNIYLKFPWQPTLLCRIKVEVTHDEPVILPVVKKPILHEYEELIDCTVACYPIEEVIAEKLRALLQTHQKLITRGWNRPRARDYYDLWCVLNKYGDSIDSVKVISTLNQKCQHRAVEYQTVEDFFTTELLAEARQHWQPTLRVLVLDLPELERVIEETRKAIQKLFKEVY